MIRTPLTEALAASESLSELWTTVVVASSAMVVVSPVAKESKAPLRVAVSITIVAALLLAGTRPPSVVKVNFMP